MPGGVNRLRLPEGTMPVLKAVNGRNDFHRLTAALSRNITRTERDAAQPGHCVPVPHKAGSPDFFQIKRGAA
jgi:hypothetical protein